MLFSRRSIIPRRFRVFAIVLSNSAVNSQLESSERAKRNIFGVLNSASARTSCRMSRGDTRLVAAMGPRKAKLEGGTRGWRGSTKKVESDGKRGQETIRLRVGANSLTFLNAPEYGKDFREEMSVPTALLGSGSQETALLWEEFSFPSRRLSSRLFFFTYSCWKRKGNARCRSEK